MDAQAVMAELIAGNPHSTGTVTTPVDKDEVVRYLGYPAGTEPTKRVAEALQRWIPRAIAVAEPRATFLVLPVVSKTRRHLTLRTPRGRTPLEQRSRNQSASSHAAGARDLESSPTSTFEGAIGEFLAPAEYVAVFVATAGQGIEALARELREQGEELGAMVVNSVGAERAEEAETEMIRRLRVRIEPVGYAATLPYSPGYCGMKLTEQRTLFALFEGIDTGVTLTDSCLMRPSKSVSGLVGIGPSEAVGEAGSPCDRCELYQCAMRR